MMRHVAIVVEGQTEAAFITQVLGPFLGPGIYLNPIITITKQTAAGAHRGGGSWRGYRDKLVKLVRQPQWDLVTTMIDFYAYPTDAPGRDCHGTGDHRPEQCVRARAAAMRADVAGDWLPYLTLHEFETLIIAAGSLRPSVLTDTLAPARFTRMIREAGGAERINDGHDTSPSKRVAATLPGYRKAQDAVAILEGAGMDGTLDLCPGVQKWVTRLRGDD